MATQERSIGPLYFARVHVNVVLCPLATADITQMHEPWRRGRCILIPFIPYQALVIGIWKKTIYDDIEEDFSEDLWINPRKLGNVRLDDIAEWDDLDGTAKEEGQDWV